MYRYFRSALNQIASWIWSERIVHDNYFYDWEPKGLDMRDLQYVRPSRIIELNWQNVKIPDEKWNICSGAKSFPSIRVYRLAELYLNSSTGLPLSPNKKIIWDLLPPNFKLSSNTIPLRELLNKKNNKSTSSFQDKIYFIPQIRHRPNFFHWMFDTLGRFEFLEMAGYDLNQIKVLLPSNATTWQMETLKAIGVTNENLEIAPSGSICIHDALITSTPRTSFRYDPLNCAWLRERIMDYYGIEKQRGAARKIFVLRKQQDGRAFLNEDELRAKFQPLGYEFYFLEELSFKEQVRLFSEAEIIIAAHGAALTNLLFAQNATTVEVFFDNFPSFYGLLAKTLGHNYSWIKVENLKLFRNNRSNGTIPILELFSILNQVNKELAI